LMFFKEILCSLAIALTEGAAKIYSLPEWSSYEDTAADCDFSLLSSKEHDFFCSPWVLLADALLLALPLEAIVPSSNSISRNSSPTWYVFQNRFLQTIDACRIHFIIDSILTKQVSSSLWKTLWTFPAKGLGIYVNILSVATSAIV